MIKQLFTVLILISSIYGFSQDDFETKYMAGAGGFHNFPFNSNGLTLQGGFLLKEEARASVSYGFAFYKEESFGELIQYSHNQFAIQGQFFLPFEKWKPYTSIGAAFLGEKAFDLPEIIRPKMGIGLEYRYKIFCPYIEGNATFLLNGDDFSPALEIGVRFQFEAQEKKED